MLLELFRDFPSFTAFGVNVQLVYTRHRLPPLSAVFRRGGTHLLGRGHGGRVGPQGQRELQEVDLEVGEELARLLQDEVVVGAHRLCGDIPQRQDTLTEHDHYCTVKTQRTVGQSAGRRTSILVHGELFHSVHKLPELVVAVFCNKLAVRKRDRC